MSQIIRTPGINGETDAEKLRQIRSYLYQLADQLNRTLDTLTAPAGTDVTEDVMVAFSRLRPLIMQSAEISDAYGQRLKSIFPTKAESLYKHDYIWQKTGELTVYARPTYAGVGEDTQHFLAFGHIQGSAVLESWVMYGPSSLLQKGVLPVRQTGDDQFVIPGAAGDRITILSSTPFKIGDE